MLTKKRGKTISNHRTRINEQIRAKEVRVIGEDGDQLGIMAISRALELAQKADLDLVEIAPDSKPPVVKIINWGKYQYQKMKEQQKNRKKAKVCDLKQMRFGLKISENDLNIKLRKVQKFLDDGHKVKLSIFFKGREMAHQELGFQMIDKVIEKLGDQIVLEQKPILAGRNLSISVRRK